RVGKGQELPLSRGEATHTSRDGLEVISYDRGAFREEYLAKKGTIEQQFVIPRPLELDGGDLVISGLVRSTGELETHDDRWVWRDGASTVALGQVFVFDKNRKQIAAKMVATRDSTTITV